MLLRPTTYLAYEDVVDWFDLKEEKAGLDGGTQANKVIQALTYTALREPGLIGTDGNLVTIAYVTGGTAGSETIVVTERAIVVTIASGASTADQIKAAVDAHFAASRLVSVVVSGSGGATQTTVSVTALSGGVNGDDLETREVRNLGRLMNRACGAVERYIQTAVLVKEFTEDYDGSNSNVLKTSHYPIKSITSLKIDFNRAFGSTSELDESNFFIRGKEDFAKFTTEGTLEASITIEGTDIVLRDDNEKFILGRIFAGSVLGSIRLVYKAGWGETRDTVPDDLMQATQMLMEYWLFKRENRDIGVKSKGVRGDSYTIIASGIPEDVTQILDPYMDVSFGDHQLPQRNHFRI